MEKIKVNYDIEHEHMMKYFEDEWGNNVAIRDWIPYEQKEMFVQELIGATLGTNDELGICYELMNRNLYYNYMLVKYYTNLDVEEIKDLDGLRKLYDYCQRSKLIDCFEDEFLKDDLAVIDDMIWRYRGAIAHLYEAEHSLGYMVKGLLNTDVNANNEETREQIEKLIDMKGALMEKNEQAKVLNFDRKNPASVKTGGAVVNLAKR